MANRETNNTDEAGSSIKVGDVVVHYCRPGFSPVEGPEYDIMFMECREISDYSTYKRTTFMNTTLIECVGEFCAGKNLVKDAQICICVFWEF